MHKSTVPLDPVNFPSIYYEFLEIHKNYKVLSPSRCKTNDIQVE